MQAIILCGGKGTRLKPFTVTIPKPLLPLGDVPIVDVVIQQLAYAGFDDIVLSLGHMAHLFAACVGDGSAQGVSIRYCNEEQPMGTAGPLRLIDGLDDNFLMMNGDILTTMNFGKLMQMHIDSGAAATITVHQRSVYIDYGVIHRDDQSCLAGYVEKPSIPYEVSMGVYVFSKRAIDFIPNGQHFDVPQLMLALKDAGEKVLCLPFDCYWQDIGRMEDYDQASMDFIASPEQFIPSLLA